MQLIVLINYHDSVISSERSSWDTNQVLDVPSRNNAIHEESNRELYALIAGCVAYFSDHVQKSAASGNITFGARKFCFPALHVTRELGR